MVSRTVLSDTNADVNKVHAEEMEKLVDDYPDETNPHRSPALLICWASRSMGKPIGPALPERPARNWVCVSML